MCCIERQTVSLMEITCGNYLFIKQIMYGESGVEYWQSFHWPEYPHLLFVQLSLMRNGFPELIFLRKLYFSDYRRCLFT